MSTPFSTIEIVPVPTNWALILSAVTSAEVNKLSVSSKILLNKISVYSSLTEFNSCLVSSSIA